jgi:hypothetical protein
MPERPGELEEWWRVGQGVETLRAVVRPRLIASGAGEAGSSAMPPHAGQATATTERAGAWVPTDQDGIIYGTLEVAYRLGG